MTFIRHADLIRQKPTDRCRISARRWLKVVGCSLAIALVAGPELSAQELHPSWRILALIYQTTDFTYTDDFGVQHRVIGSFTNAEIANATAVFQAFAAVDIPALTKGNMIPTIEVRKAAAPLSSLTRIFTRSWWPTAADLGAERDLSFDSIIVLWQTRGVNQFSGRLEDLSPEAGGLGGLACINNLCQTYATLSVFGSNLFGFGHNILKHEWGHGILFHFAGIGASPNPIVDNHIAPGGYVQCKTGTHYVYVDEPENNPIPNSIYNNESGFHHDYYSGTTALPANPQQCLGITPAAWKAGGPVTKTGGTPAPPPWVPPTTLNPPMDLQVISIVGNRVTISWTAPEDSLRPTGYVLEGGLTPGDVIGSVPADMTRTTFSFTAPTGSFYIRVHAVSGALKSAASNEIRIFVNVPAPPAPPVNLLGLADGELLQLAWQNTAGGGVATSIALDVAGSITTTVPLPATAASFSFSGVPVGTYTFSVRAINGQGSSVPANPVTLTFPGICAPPETPAQFSATNSGRVVTLSWSLPASGPAPIGYTLIVSGAFGGEIPLGGRSISATVFPGTYNVSVTATNSCGSSAPTAVKTLVIF